MIAPTATWRGAAQGVGRRLDAGVRRYEPLAIAVAVAFALVQLVSPIQLAPLASGGIAPFADAGDPPARRAEAPAESPAAPPAGPAPATPFPSASGGTGAGSTSGSASVSGTVDAGVLPGSGSDTPSAAAGDPGGPRVFAGMAAPGGAGGITVDGTAVYASTRDARIVRHGRDGSLQRTITVEGATGLGGLVAGTGDTLYAADRATGRILAVDAQRGTSRAFGTIPDVTPCVPLVRATSCDGSAVDRKPLPVAMALDDGGNLYVADAGQSAIWKLPSDGGTARQWAVDPAVLPPDQANGPTALAFDGAGNLVYVLPSTGPDDTGGLFLRPVQENGSAGSRATVATFARGQRPAGLALSRSGRAYVTLSGTSQVVVVAPDGTQSAPVDVDAALGAGRLVAAAFLGEDVLLAGEPATAGAASAVVRLPAGEPGAPVGGRR